MSDAWQPWPLARVLAEFERERIALETEARAFVERCRITPIEVPVRAHAGEAVWAVARCGDRHLYWSDVEEGWEWDVLDAGGAIASRGANQFELRHAVHRAMHGQWRTQI
jgi:hypothetical protein